MGQQFLARRRGGCALGRPFVHSLWLGRRTVNVAPEEGLLITSIAPPWFCTIHEIFLASVAFSIWVTLQKNHSAKNQEPTAQLEQRDVFTQQ